MTPALGALVALVSTSPGDVHVAVAARSDARVSRFDSGGAQMNSTLLEIAPRASLTAELDGARLSGAYTLGLRARDSLQSSSGYDTLHRADLRGEDRLLGPWHFSASASATYGTTDLVTEAMRGNTSATEPITTRLSLRYLDAMAALRATRSFDPRLELALVLSGSANGGADPAARAVLPVVGEVSGRTALTWHATRRDVLAGGLDLTSALVSTPRDTLSLAVLSGSWRRQLDRRLEGLLGAGIAAGLANTTGRPDTLGLFPVAEAGLAHSLDRPLRIKTHASLRAESYVDRTSRAVEERVAFTLTTGWQAADPLTLTARGIIAAFPSDAATNRMWQSGLDIGMAWAFARRATLGLGAGALWQRARAAPLTSFTDYAVSVTAAYEADVF